jgi:lactoylglutathione lyase
MSIDFYTQVLVHETAAHFGNPSTNTVWFLWVTQQPRREPSWTYVHGSTDSYDMALPHGHRLCVDAYAARTIRAAGSNVTRRSVRSRVAALSLLFVTDPDRYKIELIPAR